MSKTLVLRPRISEKAYAMTQTKNTYVFDVPTSANRFEVATAVGAQYDVTVISVNMLNIKGKPKRTVRKGGRAITGKRVDIKKAYVTLKAGDSLPIFAAVEDAEAEAEKQAAKAKKKEKK